MTLITSHYGTTLQIQPYMRDGMPGPEICVSTQPGQLAEFDPAKLAAALNGIVPGFRASYVPKRPVLILSSHTPESGGGFCWRFGETNGNRDFMYQEYNKEVEYGYTHVTLLEIHILAPLEPTSEERQAITDLIDVHLLDLIEARQIGHIIESYDRWGVHPGVTATQEDDGQGAPQPVSHGEADTPRMAAARIQDAAQGTPSRKPYVTLGDVAAPIQRMKEDGITRESIEYVLNEVYWR